MLLRSKLAMSWGSFAPIDSDKNRKKSETMRPTAQVLKQYNIFTNHLMQQKVMLLFFHTGLLPVVGLFDLNTYI